MAGSFTVNLSYRNPVTDALESNPDGVPNAFTITPQTGVALDSLITSAPITVNGYVTAAISVSGGQYNIDGGAFASTPGTINLGQVPRVRVQSGDTNLEDTSATLTIGGVSANFVVTTLSGDAELIGRLTIVGTTVPTDEGEGLFGFGVVPGTSTISVVEDAEGKALRAHYNADQTGGNSVYGGTNLDPAGDREVWVRYYARMPNAKHGLKNIKLFGIRDGDNYANVTFGLDYTGVDNGCMYQVSFGDGTTISNDTANVIELSGANPAAIGRSYGTAVVLTPQGALWPSSNWGTTKHLFELMFRHNTGTTALDEVANGACIVKIDGVTYVDATGLFTRHYSNGYFASVSMFGVTQGNTSALDFDIFDGATTARGGFIP